MLELRVYKWWGQRKGVKDVKAFQAEETMCYKAGKQEMALWGTSTKVSMVWVKKHLRTWLVTRLKIT